MEMSVDSFKEWLENDCKWHWDMNIDENGILTVSVVFDSSFPTLSDGHTWAADAWFIAPSFRQKRIEKQIRVKGNLRMGGHFAFQTPEWYPLLNSGWKILSTPRVVSTVFQHPFPGRLKAGEGNSISWKPYAELGKFSSLIDWYTTSYGIDVIRAYNLHDDPSYSGTERYDLSKRGEIRKQSLDIYLSVGVSFIVRNGGIDNCVARLFGVPKHFVSKDLL